MRQAFGRVWARRAAAGGVVMAAVGGVALAQPPALNPAPNPASRPVPAAALPAPNSPVAHMYGGTVAVTRQELGEYLIARCGKARLDLLVNRIIVERECAARGITVTDTEVLAAFQSDLDGLAIDRAKFVDEMLTQYNRTLYEWMEDTIRPKLMLMKLIHDQVQVTDADVQLELEKEYGEKRLLQVVVFPAQDDPKAIQDTWVKIHKDEKEFDRVARTQADPRLASTAGMSQPITIHTHGAGPEKDIVTKRAFAMNVGEVSEILKTGIGHVVIKLRQVIPAAMPTGPALDKVVPVCRQRALELKLTAELPKKFKELQKAADPRTLYTGPEKWDSVAKVIPAGPAVIQPVQATTTGKP